MTKSATIRIDRLIRGEWLLVGTAHINHERVVESTDPDDLKTELVHQVLADYDRSNFGLGMATFDGVEYRWRLGGHQVETRMADWRPTPGRGDFNSPGWGDHNYSREEWGAES